VGDLAGARCRPEIRVVDGEGNPAAGARVVSGLAGVSHSTLAVLRAAGPAVAEAEEEQGCLRIDGEVA